MRWASVMSASRCWFESSVINAPTCPKKSEKVRSRDSPIGAVDSVTQCEAKFCVPRSSSSSYELPRTVSSPAEAVLTHRTGTAHHFGSVNGLSPHTPDLGNEHPDCMQRPRQCRPILFMTRYEGNMFTKAQRAKKVAVAQAEMIRPKRAIVSIERRHTTTSRQMKQAKRKPTDRPTGPVSDEDGRTPTAVAPLFENLNASTVQE
jgi:hypothetical protein